MVIGLIGLGRMGQAIAARLLHAGFDVCGYDPYTHVDPHTLDSKDIKSSVELPSTQHTSAGITAGSFTQACAGKFMQVQSLKDCAAHTRVFWLMVPAGEPVDAVITALIPLVGQETVIIDGGNSLYKDSIRRHDLLSKHKIAFLDCGTSGGLHGRALGFSLMIGGDEPAYTRCEPIFKAIAAPDGYGRVGPAGAGHYVKMIHNGIEYALLQAYAEGFHLLKGGSYNNLDLEKISQIWSNGSIIRSWILKLTHDIYAAHTDFDAISGAIGENKTGLWTVEEAERQGVPVDLIKRALAIRAESRTTGGDYATKLVALLRKEFGGHPVEYLTRKKDA